jgi:hypothetical protein
MYYFQDKNSDTPIYGVKNADAFHVLYYLVNRWSSYSQNKYPNTFSVSLYSDQSIRFRYHTINSSPRSSDIFGLWGSFASSDSKSNLWYHEEKLHDSNWYHEEKLHDSNIIAGQDIVFAKGV